MVRRGLPHHWRPRRTTPHLRCRGRREDKLTAAAAAGFDGVEIFEPDLVASPLSPAELRRHCSDSGLSTDLYQPFRDLDSTVHERFAANLRRAEHKFGVMERLGVDTVLVCSSVAADAVAEPDLLATQLHALAERAGRRGLRVAYEVPLRVAAFRLRHGGGLLVHERMRGPRGPPSAGRPPGTATGAPSALPARTLRTFRELREVITRAVIVSKSTVTPTGTTCGSPSGRNVVSVHRRRSVQKSR